MYKNKMRKCVLISKLKAIGIQDRKLFDKILNGSTNYLKKIRKQYLYFTEVHQTDFLRNLFSNKTFLKSFKNQKLALIDKVLWKIIREDYGNTLNNKPCQEFIGRILKIIENEVIHYSKTKTLQDLAQKLTEIKKYIIKDFQRDIEERKNLIIKGVNKEFTENFEALKDLTDYVDYLDYMKREENKPKGWVKDKLQNYLEIKVDSDHLIQRYNKLLYKNLKLTQSVYFPQAKETFNQYKKNLAELKEIYTQISEFNNKEYLNEKLRELGIENLTEITNKELYNAIHRLYQRYKARRNQAYWFTKNESTDLTELRGMITLNTKYDASDSQIQDFVKANKVQFQIFLTYQNSRKLKKITQEASIRSNQPVNFPNWLTYMKNNENIKVLSFGKLPSKAKSNKPNRYITYLYSTSQNVKKDIAKGKYNLIANYLNTLTKDKLPKIDNFENSRKNVDSIDDYLNPTITLDNFEKHYRLFKVLERRFVKNDIFVPINFKIRYFDNKSSHFRNQLVHSFQNYCKSVGCYKEKVNKYRIFYPTKDYDNNVRSFFGIKAFKQPTEVNADLERKAGNIGLEHITPLSDTESYLKERLDCFINVDGLLEKIDKSKVHFIESKIRNLKDEIIEPAELQEKLENPNCLQKLVQNEIEANYKKIEKLESLKDKLGKAKSEAKANQRNFEKLTAFVFDKMLDNLPKHLFDLAYEPFAYFGFDRDKNDIQTLIDELRTEYDDFLVSEFSEDSLEKWDSLEIELYNKMNFSLMAKYMPSNTLKLPQNALLLPNLALKGLLWHELMHIEEPNHKERFKRLEGQYKYMEYTYRYCKFVRELVKGFDKDKKQIKQKCKKNETLDVSKLIQYKDYVRRKAKQRLQSIQIGIEYFNEKISELERFLDTTDLHGNNKKVQNAKKDKLGWKIRRAKASTKTLPYLLVLTETDKGFSEDVLNVLGYFLRESFQKAKETTKVRYIDTQRELLSVLDLALNNVEGITINLEKQYFEANYENKFDELLDSNKELFQRDSCELDAIDLARAMLKVYRAADTRKESGAYLLEVIRTWYTWITEQGLHTFESTIF